MFGRYLTRGDKCAIDVILLHNKQTFYASRIKAFTGKYYRPKKKKNPQKNIVSISRKDLFITFK